MRIFAMPCLLMLVLAASAALAQAPAAPKQGARPTPAQPPGPPQGQFDVYEWVVLVCDPNQPAANAERMFKSTLPDFTGARRPAATDPESAGEPSPAGVIRIVGTGAAAEGTKVDVLVQCPAGRFLGSWPRGKGRADRQLWEAYELRAEPGDLKVVNPGHWFGALREAPSLYPRRGRVGERFLLYDAELRYALPLQMSSGAGGSGYRLANSGGSALFDVTVFKPEQGGWRTGAVAQMPAAKGVAPTTYRATAPATSPAAALPPGVPAEIAARMLQRRAGTRVGGAAPEAPPAPTVAPSTQPAPGASTAAVNP